MANSGREPSLRADARARCCNMEGGLIETLPLATTPLPSPPPQGGREQAEQGGREGRGQERKLAECVERESAEPAAPLRLQPDYMARLRALYEDSALPVPEIARLAGVTERMIYKHALKRGWKRRAARLAAQRRAGAGLLSDAVVAAATAEAEARAARRTAEREADAQMRSYALLARALVELHKICAPPAAASAGGEPRWVKKAGAPISGDWRPGRRRGVWLLPHERDEDDVRARAQAARAQGLRAHGKHYGYGTDNPRALALALRLQHAILTQMEMLLMQRVAYEPATK
jgi:hypothetical protein